MNAKKLMIRSIYRFHFYYHIRRILKILEVPLTYENSFNQYYNPYNYEKFIGICLEYGVSNTLTNWRNQKYFSTWQSRAWEQVSLVCHILMKTHSPDGLLKNPIALLRLESKSYLKQFEIMHI